MRAVVKRRPGPGVDLDADWPEVDCPADSVRIEVAAASVCGTDREIVAYSTAAQAFGLTLPNVMGHEFAGTVVEVGEDVTSLRPGDRVAVESHLACGRCTTCRRGDAHNCENLRLVGLHVPGGFAERAVVPGGACFLLPDSLETRTGALLEPCGVAVHAVQRFGQPLLGQRVLITGCGPVGLVTAQLCLTQGAAVTVLEPNPYRQGLAERAGAVALPPSATAEQLADLTDGQGYDVAFEASGAPAALQSCLDAVRREAGIVTIGHPGAPFALDIAQYVNKKGVTLQGIYGRRLWSTWELVARLVASGLLDLESLVTHELALEEVGRAVELLDGEACKVLLVPSLEVPG